MLTALKKIEYKWIVAVIFVAGLFLEILDTTIVNVAIPTLAKEFDATRASMEWVVLGYLLSLAIWIPASGWIGDKVGTKKTFLFALLTFTVASALCGQAHSVGELVAFRILQGVGGGMLTPVGTTMLFRAFPPAERLPPGVLAPPRARDATPRAAPGPAGFLLQQAGGRQRSRAASTPAGSWPCRTSCAARDCRHGHRSGC